MLAKEATSIRDADVENAAAIMKGVEATLERVRERGVDDAIAQGQVFELAGMPEKAGKVYLGALGGDDGRSACEALARYIIVLFRQDRRTEALESANRLAAIDPEFTMTSVVYGETYSSMTLLGDALFVNKRLDDAQSAYDAALKTLPGDSYVSSRMALLLLAKNETKSAIRLSRAVRESPRFADLHNMLKLGEEGLINLELSEDAAMTVVLASPAGRPFRVGEARQAAPIARSDWS